MLSVLMKLWVKMNFYSIKVCISVTVNENETSRFSWHPLYPFCFQTAGPRDYRKKKKQKRIIVPATNRQMRSV